MSPPATEQKRPEVVIHYERDFPYAPDVAYAWLTDYADDDHERAGAIIRKRIVVRRTEREVELEGDLDTLGQRSRGRAIVRLYPEEHRWVADLAKGRWVYEYRLTPTPGGCRLAIDYRLGARRWTRRAMFTILKPFIRRELDRMWDGFDAAMRRELTVAQTPSA